MSGAVVPKGMESAGPDYGFAPGRIAGGLLFVSGQIGFSADGSIPDDVEEQARLAFAGVEAVLREGGCTFADVVAMTTLHVGDCTSVNAWFLPLKKDVFPAPYPAWTSWGVTSLALPGALIEIAVVAQVPQA